MFHEQVVDSVGLFRFHVKKEQDAMYIASERLMLTDDNEVVREGDPRARRLLVAKGGELSRQDAEKYKLVPTTGTMEVGVPRSDVALSLEEVSREPSAAEQMAHALPSNIGGINAASKAGTGPAMDTPPASVNAPPAAPPSTTPAPPVTAPKTAAAPKVAATATPAASAAPKGTVPATPPVQPPAK